MLSIRVGGETIELEDESADELRSRLAAEDDGPLGTELLAKLDQAAASGEAATLDPGELALLGVVIETWAASEVAVDAADVEELREAIRDEIG